MYSVQLQPGERLLRKDRISLTEGKLVLEARTRGAENAHPEAWYPSGGSRWGSIVNCLYSNSHSPNGDTPRCDEYPQW